MSDKTKILFVCLGNIIRSPLAENMFDKLASQARVEHKYFVESAGTAGYHIGESPDSRMRKVAAEFGLVYDGKARQFYQGDFDNFDLIVPQDMSNKTDILSLSRHENDSKKVFTMRSFDPEGSPNDGVPDPYYGGIDGFHITYKIVERSCKGLLDTLESGKMKL